MFSCCGSRAAHTPEPTVFFDAELKPVQPLRDPFGVFELGGHPDAATAIAALRDAASHPEQAFAGTVPYLRASQVLAVSPTERDAIERRFRGLLGELSAATAILVDKLLVDAGWIPMHTDVDGTRPVSSWCVRACVRPSVAHPPWLLGLIDIAMLAVDITEIRGEQFSARHRP